MWHCQDERAIHVPARKAKCVDVTGAGDSVMAALGVAMASGLDLPEACEYAVEAAALQVEQLGVSPVSLPLPTLDTACQSG